MPHLSAMRSAPSNWEVISYCSKYVFGIGTPRPNCLLPAMPIGMRLITSTPQARATSTTPLPTSAVARLVACWLLPHCASTVVAATEIGRPALSHAVRKVPTGGEFRVQEERGGRILPAGDPAPDLVPVAEQILRLADAARAPGGRPLLYARVDLVRDDRGAPVLMELELIEPSLYLRTDPGAPGRFAAAVDAWARLSPAASRLSSGSL